MTIKEIRESINIRIYDKKKKVLAGLTILNIIVSLIALSTLVYYYGYELTIEQKEFSFSILEASFVFYIFRFFVKLFFDFHPPTFIKDNWFEASVILLLLVEGISYNFFGRMIIEPLFIYIGFKDFGAFSMVFIQIFIFVLMLNGIFKQRNYRPWMKIHPGWLFTISIAMMTLVGGLLLMLPEMSIYENGMSFIDSLFLSMSSVSVTGLSTVDLASDFTFKGQMIVLILIKLGGLNTIAFGALMLIVAKFGVGIKYHEVIEDFVNKDSILKANSMLLKNCTMGYNN